MCNFVASTIMTMPADGLAPLGAKLSAGKVMSRFMSYIYTIYTLYVIWDWHLKG